MAWLLDTNVLSELRRPRPEPRVIAFVSSLPLEQVYISSITLAEIRYGIERAGDYSRRIALNDWLINEIRPMFHQRVLQVTEDILLKWRLLVEEGRKVGHTYSQPDILIAATAIQYALTVVTRDRSHYDKAGVTVINPWATP
jgi:predicted nucleic acid-binding protein